MGIETVATYDPIAREFIIHTPNNEASKYWIGGTGQHGKVCWQEGETGGKVCALCQGRGKACHEGCRPLWE